METARRLGCDSWAAKTPTLRNFSTFGVARARQSSSFGGPARVDAVGVSNGRAHFTSGQKESPLTTANVATVLMHIELDLIDAHPLNPRLFENAEFIAYLTSEMAKNGYPDHHAGLFRRKPDGRYETIIAHRRVQAARAAGLLVVPGWVGDLSDERVLLELSKSNLQEGLSRLELAVHSLLVERAHGKRGLGLKAFALEHQVDPTVLSRYRRGAEVFVNVRGGLEREIAHGCQERCEHLVRIRKAPQELWAALIESCVKGDWSIERTEREVVELSVAPSSATPNAARIERRVEGDQSRSSEPQVANLDAGIQHGDGVLEGVESAVAGLSVTGSVDASDEEQAQSSAMPAPEIVQPPPAALTEEPAPNVTVPPPASGSTEQTARSEAPTQTEDSEGAVAPPEDVSDTKAVAKKLSEFWVQLSFESKRAGFVSLWLNILKELGNVKFAPVQRHLEKCNTPEAIGECLRSLEAIVMLILRSPSLAKEVDALHDLVRRFGSPVDQVAQTGPVPATPVSPPEPIKGVVKAKPRAKGNVAPSKKAKRRARA